MRSHPMRSDPMLSDPIQPGPMLSDPMRPDPMLSDPMRPDSMLSDPMRPDPMLSRDRRKRSPRSSIVVACTIKSMACFRRASSMRRTRIVLMYSQFETGSHLRFDRRSNMKSTLRPAAQARGLVELLEQLEPRRAR